MPMKPKTDLPTTTQKAGDPRLLVLRASMRGWQVSKWAQMPPGLSRMLVMLHTISVTLHNLLNVPAPFQHQLNESDENNDTCLIGVCEYYIPLSGARHSTQ